jgi:hypothetical protein
VWSMGAMSASRLYRVALASNGRSIVGMATTDYLYGDSTPSPLKTDFIAFLRDVVDAGVTMLLCDARLGEAVKRAATFSEVTEKEIESAEALIQDVSRTVERSPIADPKSLAARCAARLLQAAVDVARSEVDAARGAVEAEKTRVAQEAKSEREACTKALETLLLRHELPGETGVVHLRIDGASYAAELHGHAPYGLDWVVTTEIPASSPLAHVLRIERLVERLEVQAPEEAGWIRKETKIRPQRLDRLYLSQLTIDPAETLLRLRAAPDGTEGGFDVSFRREPRRVQLVRIAERGAEPDAPYDVNAEDSAKLWDLLDQLAQMAMTLLAHKKAILRATLDDAPTDQLEAPRTLVDRIVAHIAPIVQEIGRRSLTPGEFVLKRLVSENQREEIFVSRAELEQKLQPLSRESRRAFEALGLSDREPAHGEGEPEKRPPPSRAPKPPPPVPRTPASASPPDGPPRV